MSTEASAIPATGRRSALSARARAVPRSVWVMALAWSVVTRLLMAPWVVIHQDNSDPTSMLLLQMHLNATFLFVWGVALAPLIAVLWPWWGMGIALLGLLPIGLAEWMGLQLSGCLAMLGVAACGSWRPGRCLLPAALALVAPAILCWPWLRMELIFAGNHIQTEGMTTGDGMLVGSVYLAFVIFAVLMHWAMGDQRTRGELKAERARLRTQQAEVRNEAVALDERARLARDLHDIVAHRISLVAVRAETAPYTHLTMDDETRQIFIEIAADARTALEEMRGVLGVLHRSTDAGVRTPQPVVDDIPILIEDARSAGVAVLCSGVLPPMSEAVGSVAYRVVQEALTNARRHSTGRVTVDFSTTDQWAVIRVSNPCGESIGPAGRGLTGMRERLSLVNGSLRTEVCEGVFVLTAMLPRTVS